MQSQDLVSNLKYETKQYAFAFVYLYFFLFHTKLCDSSTCISMHVFSKFKTVSLNHPLNKTYSIVTEFKKMLICLAIDFSTIVNLEIISQIISIQINVNSFFGTTSIKPKTVSLSFMSYSITLCFSIFPLALLFPLHIYKGADICRYW